MRILLWIFGIYILALSAMPCSDVSNNCNSDPAFVAQDFGHNHGTDRDDKCSPFCFCHCCSVPSNTKLTALEIQIVHPLIPTKVSYPIRNTSLVSNFSPNIWQPPKIKG